jgi:hypothetical protein
MVSRLYKTHYEVRIPYKNADKLIEYLKENKLNYSFFSQKLNTDNLYKIIKTCPIGLQWGMEWINKYQCFICPQNYDFVLKGTSEFYSDDVTTFLSEISLFCRDFVFVEYYDDFEEEKIRRNLYLNKNGICEFVKKAGKVLSYSDESEVDSDDESEVDSDDESEVDSDDESSQDESDFFNVEKYIYCQETSCKEEVDFEKLTNLYGFSKDKIFNNDANSWDGYKGSFYPDGTPVKFIDQMTNEEREEYNKKTFPLTYKEKYE